MFRWGAVSITGNFRENNEDRFHVDPSGRFFLVADGMGGQCAGEKASELAIELISERLASQVDFSAATGDAVVSAIDKAVSVANSEIIALGEVEPTFKNMGTTIAFVVISHGELYVGGVGDSRAYLRRDGKLTQLTEDHSLTQALVKAGTIAPEDAATHRYRNVLYKYLGEKNGGAGTDPKRFRPQAGDRLMLCSDGICDGASDEQIDRILNAENDPQKAAEKLVSAAQAGGSKDNITCVVLFVEQAGG